ncbi:unnamed protein product [Gongylonema pulchrum]|uniref:PH domain-containing protein n=1 Tax=Gongylonema pulchrum TaxID=637853 RepID=A0A183EG67_9BILA|nr:unnamed protein product [Gongylonema pulchrum]
MRSGAGSFLCAPRACSTNPAQADQAHFLKDEVFDNHIPLQPPSGPTTSTGHLLTPSSTPTAQRKNRRISNLFRPKDHGHEDKSHRSTIDVNMGMGRTIPVKQGHLYKRSSKTLNKEWKKKYVCLHSDGRLSYHQTLKEYMEKDASGKEVFLGLATVRVAGRQKPRNTHRTQTHVLPGRDLHNNKNAGTKQRESLDPRLALSIASACDASTGQDNKAFTDEPCTNGEAPVTTSASSAKKKKGHRRLGSAVKNDEEDDCEFEIVTCDQKRWEFSATSPEERDEWVAAIEELIGKSLQAQMSQKQNGRLHGNKTESLPLFLQSFLLY